MSKSSLLVTVMWLLQLWEQSLGEEILSLFQTVETKGSESVGSWNVGNHTFVGVKASTHLFHLRVCVCVCVCFLAYISNKTSHKKIHTFMNSIVFLRRAVLPVAVSHKHCMNTFMGKDLFHIKHLQVYHIVGVGKDGKSTMNII